MAEYKSFDLKFSRSWLDNFKLRWNLGLFRFHGEAGDIDAISQLNALPKLKEKLAQYYSKDVFNVD